MFATGPGTGFSRRDLLHVGASGLLGLGLADLLRAEAASPAIEPRADGMILVWLSGGPATIDMWDPKPDAPQEIRGEFRSIPTALPGIHLCEHLPRLAATLDRSILIRSLSHNIPDHAPGAQYMMTGNKPTAALEHPSLGSLAARLLPARSGVPPYFAFGQPDSSGAGFLGAAFNPFEVVPAASGSAASLDGLVLPAGMTPELLEERRGLSEIFDERFRQSRGATDVAATLTKFQEQAIDILQSNRIARAFDHASESDSVRSLYGPSPLGHSMLTARRLVEAGARFVTLASSGWDTHSGNFTTLRRLLPPLDQALSALVIDLNQRGMLERTIVCCAGEFGRTPRVNRTAGRDHWSRAMSVFLAGGGLKRGFVYGGTDDQGMDPDGRAYSPDDFAATLLWLLGFPSRHVVTTTSGRPVEVFKNGTVLREVIA